MLRELIEQDTPLKKVASTRGGEYAGPCPWCGGQDCFLVWPNAERPGYWCRQCGKHGDAIQFLRERHGLSYRQACEQLRLLMRRPTIARPTPPPPMTAPSPLWQDRAVALIDHAVACLWDSTGAKALAYLRQRGFRDATLREAHIGYQPCEVYDAPQRWGRPADSKSVWIPRGITLPFYLSDQLWKVWIRRPSEDPKYVALAGSNNALYGSDMLRPGHPAMLVEGIFDALAVHQVAGDLIVAVASGTSGARTVPSLGKLALVNPVLVSLDADGGGENASTWWLRVLGARARRWRPLVDDPAAMLQAGTDLRGWVEAGLEEKTHAR